MATYKLKFDLYQDSAGDEPANVTISVNGTDVVSAQDVTSTDASSPNSFVVDAVMEDIGNNDDSHTAAVVVTFNNQYYVDSANDRNVVLTGVYGIVRYDDGNYYSRLSPPPYPSYERDADDNLVPVSGYTPRDGEVRVARPSWMQASPNSVGTVSVKAIDFDSYDWSSNQLDTIATSIDGQDVTDSAVTNEYVKIWETGANVTLTYNTKQVDFLGLI
jgi:hypothetical protein